MKKITHFTAMVVAVYGLLSTLASAQDVQKIGDYLSKVNYAYVSFEGEISYDKMEDTFRLSIDEEWFSAVLDAGRETREQIQASCAGESSFDIKWCAVTGEGTVEIRGADIWISIEKVLKLD